MTENEQEEIEKDKQEQDEPKKVEKTKEEKREDRLGWMRFIVLNLMALIPLATGMGCLIGGNTHGNHDVAFAGLLILVAGLPAMMIIGITAGLIWKIRSIRKAEENAANATEDKPTATDETHSDEAKEQTPSQREHEQAMIAAVNDSHYSGSRAKMASYEIEHVAEAMKHAPKWGLPLGLTCFFSLFALLIVATVLLIKRIFVGAIICAAIVGVVLITTFIVMAVSRAKATNGDIGKAKKITEGKVKACFMVGTTTTKSGGVRHGNGGTVRIHGVTYQVIVIADGKEYRAFSKQFYETNENVTVAIMSKTKAKIVENADPETNHIQATDK